MSVDIDIRAEVAKVRDALDDAFECTCPEDDDDGKHVEACPYCRPANALGRIADDVLPNQIRDLRDSFAMAALTGILANADAALDNGHGHALAAAYRYADAALEARRR